MDKLCRQTQDLQGTGQKLNRHIEKIVRMEMKQAVEKGTVDAGIIDARHVVVAQIHDHRRDYKRRKLENTGKNATPVG